MLERTDSQGIGVDRIAPEIVRIEEFSCTSMRSVCADRHQTGAQNSAAEKHKAKADERSVSAFAPHDDPASF